MFSERLHAFTVEELHALVFRLDVAATVEPLDDVAAELREEMLRELKESEPISGAALSLLLQLAR